MSQSAAVPIAEFSRFRPAAPVPVLRNPGFFRYLHEMRKNPIAAFGMEAYEERYVYAEALGLKSILVNDPDAIRRVLFDNVANYVKSDEFLKMIKPALGNSVLTTEGAAWRFHRRITAPMFQMRHVAGFAPEMAAATQTMLTRWQPGMEVDVAQEMMRLTYDVISRTMFSSDVGLPFENMAAAFEVYLDTLGRVDLSTLFLPGWVPTPSRMRGHKALAFLKKELGAFVAARRAALAAAPESVPQDLLTLMLQARDPEGGTVFGDAEVFDNVMTFIFAGHETTANALTWTFYLLSQFPEWDERVGREAADVLGGREASAADVMALGTVRMVLEESMRLYPPAPFISRVAVDADTLCGQRIKPRTTVAISPWVVHRHKLLWRDPDYFDPTRFAPGARDAIPRYAYLPFGGGPRICIGMAFAMQEAAIILSMVARQYRLVLSPGQTVDPLARVTLRPRDGLKMRIEPR